jgi:ArsR family transcriptional regulator
MTQIDPIAVFSALSDETRLRLMLLLASEGELCVCELTHALGQSQPKISRHLSLLREIALVTDRREGTWIHYRLNQDLPAWTRELLDTLIKGPGKEKLFADDRRAVNCCPVRPPSRCCA